MTESVRDPDMAGPDVVARTLTRILGEDVHIAGAAGAVMSGAAARMQSRSGDLFVKWSSGRYAAGLCAEAAGLRELAGAQENAVPRIHVAEGDVPFILAMDWIEAGNRGERYWEELARLLVGVHRCTRPAYGYDSDNFIGATPQDNGREESWPVFFRRHRLEPQRRLAEEAGLWRPSWNAPFDRLLEKLDQILPANPEASLVHGDLWSGNVLVTARGEPVLIDPAVYYGHYEVDLAMARLFGGFSERFFEAYEEASPSEDNAGERVRVYNLYHLLNHVNLFGDAYAPSVGRTLTRF